MRRRLRVQDVTSVRLVADEKPAKPPQPERDVSFLAQQVGNKLMRAPCLIQGPDGAFQLVWTTGWGDRGTRHGTVLRVSKEFLATLP